jgi:AraC family transcriptional regulator
MTSLKSTSAEAHVQQVRGELVAASSGWSWKDLLVHIYTLARVEESVIVPAVAEPLIVLILSGTTVIEERDLGGAWQAHRVEPGDFYLTTSETPYELRWKTTGPAPVKTMNVYLGLPIFKRAIKDVLGRDEGPLRLREVSGEKDPKLGALLEQLRNELTASHPASHLFVQGIAQSLAVHLVRTYTDPSARSRERRGGLPAFKLRKATDFLQAHLDEEFDLGTLAREVEMSEFHFSRLFKKTIGFSPSRYFIRLRVAHARRLLRETTRSIIEIGLDVGYTSPSHFAHIFRREVGVSPSEYREGR